MKIKKYARMLVDNWPAKILALAIAVFLFYFYKINSTEIRYMSVPLEINLNSSFTFADAYPSEARITLRGTSGSISIIHESDIYAFADLTNRDKAGVFREPVRIRRLGNALYADPLEIKVNPDVVEVKIDEKLVKTLDVTPVITGYPAENFELADYSVVPDRLTIEGPSGIINNIDELKTERVILSGRQSNFNMPVRIDLNQPLVVFPDGNEVQFRGIIEQSLLIRNIAPVEIRLVNQNEDFSYELDVNSGSIRVEADRTLIEKIGRENSSLYVDLENISQPGVYNMPVFASVEEAADILNISPETVRVYVSRRGRI